MHRLQRRGRVAESVQFAVGFVIAQRLIKLLDAGERGRGRLLRSRLVRSVEDDPEVHRHVDFAEFKSLERLLGRSNGEGTQGDAAAAMTRTISGRDCLRGDLIVR